MRSANLKLMERQAPFRWALVNGSPQMVTVLVPVFSERDEHGCTTRVGWQHAKGARCNGDGTASVAFWSEQHRDWRFASAANGRPGH